MERQKLTDKEIYKVIPESFTICNHTIHVIIRDTISFEDNQRYGQWNEVLQIIELAKAIMMDGEEVPVTLEQVQNTFEHELAHCWEFFSGYEYDEHRTKLMANFRRQFDASKKFKS